MYLATVAVDIILFALILVAAFLIERSKARLQDKQLSQLDSIVTYGSLMLFVPPMIDRYLERHAWRLFIFSPAWFLFILSLLMLGLLSFFPPIIEVRLRAWRRRRGPST